MTTPQIGLIILSLFSALAAVATGADATRITVTLDRGRDLGQSFGSLFELSSEDTDLVIGAGFQNAYNTEFRADRHAVQFFIRPTRGARAMTTEELPRPNNKLTGSYLFSRDGVVYSAYGGMKTWDTASRSWRRSDVRHETMRVGNTTLTFAGSSVLCDGRTILEPPEAGSYQRFFYAHGHLCFYHVNRRDKPYRLYLNDEDGFSRLYACPWTPEQPRVELANAVTLRLPVVGETTFAWGQLGPQIVTGSNIGGFYVFQDGSWKMQLEPVITRSYQLYSSLSLGGKLLMGQYPTGRVFAYDGITIRDQNGWPPVLPGVSGSAREAQTTTVYGGDLFVGVWPWAEMWRYNPDSRGWSFMQRMFDHPTLTDKITHPYEVENKEHPVLNLWGQRITSLVTNGPDLFVSTSSKGVAKWKPEAFPFLAPEKWKSYGKIYRVTIPGHLSAPTRWTDGPTTLEFIIGVNEITIVQDGTRLATTQLVGPLAKHLERLKRFKTVQWGSGIYGRFEGVSLKGTIAGL
jgi:hypothetical protein